jgi:histone H3/H4
MTELGARGDKTEQARVSEAAKEFTADKVPEKMRDIARKLQQGDPQAARPDAGQQVARSLDRLADRVNGSAGGRDREGQQLGENLSRARDMRERLAELERQIAEQSQRPSASAGDGSNGTASPSASKPGERSHADAERLAELRRQYLDALKDAGADERLREAIAGTSGAGSTPIGQTMVTAAPGTEAFKQDFARWESLHREVTLGLERYEASLSKRTVERAARERLRSGGSDSTPPEYASSVERYFRTLAAERH